jgi:hypothetical protein
VANVVTLMIAVLPQTGQRHRSANGAADEGQSQWASGCFIVPVSSKVFVDEAPFVTIKAAV